MTINEERVEQIEFSDPYFIARGRVLVPGDSDITGVADLAGKNVCTALGSTYEANLKKQAPEAKLKLVDSYSECLELVQNGAVDAVSTDDVILTGMIIQDDTLKLVGDELTQEPYGAGIKKGDTQMVEFVNGVFKGLKDDGIGKSGSAIRIRLGRRSTKEAVNFAVFSETASAVDLCLFDSIEGGRASPHPHDRADRPSLARCGPGPEAGSDSMVIASLDPTSRSVERVSTAPSC